MDRLVAMRVFVESVDRGSITAAADALEMSRAMASRHLEGLEAWLGARLLHRTTRRLALTDAGEHALGSCRELLALADDVVSVAGQAAGEARGRLRVTASHAFAQAQLIPALVDFQAQYPKVEIDLVALDRPVNLVEERVDLAIHFGSRVDPGLIARPLAICRSVLCAAPAYLRRAGTPRHPRDLADHRCVTHSFAAPSRYRLRLGQQTTTVVAHGSLTANGTLTVRAAVLAGAGIAMLPTYYVGEDLARGALEVVLPRYTLEPLVIQAVYLSRKHQPKALRLLIDFLAARFGGTVAPWDRAVRLRRGGGQK